MLITKYQKQQTIIRLKGIYSQLNQAIRRSTVDNGEVSGWDFDSPDWFDRYLADYLVGTQQKWKDLSDSNSIPYKQSSGARETGLALLRPGFGGSKVYSMLNGVEIIFYINKGAITTPDYATSIIIDINSTYTGPNQFGKDTFMFVLWKDGALLPSGYRTTNECKVPDGVTRDFFKSNTCLSYACNKKSRGMWCAALLMIDGWQMLPDYPW